MKEALSEISHKRPTRESSRVGLRRCDPWVEHLDSGMAHGPTRNLLQPNLEAYDLRPNGPTTLPLPRPKAWSPICLSTRSLCLNMSDDPRPLSTTRALHVSCSQSRLILARLGDSTWWLKWLDIHILYRFLSFWLPRSHFRPYWGYLRLVRLLFAKKKNTFEIKLGVINSLSYSMCNRMSSRMWYGLV